MEIKICGITKKEEVQFLNKLDIDYIGLVFCESKRKVSIETALEILKEVDSKIKVIGVFRDNTLDFVLNVLKNVKLYGVQLHGAEGEDFFKEIRKHRDIKIIKGTFINNLEEIEKIEKLNCDLFILDGKNPGSGEVFDHSIIKNFNKKYFLAGGINKENLKNILKVIKPDGIDVSTGVEEIINGERVKSKSKIIEILKIIKE